MIDDECRKRFAFHFVCDDEKRLAGGAEGLQHGQQLRDAADVHVAQQDARLVEHDVVAVRFDEQGRQVAAIDQRAVHRLERVVEFRAVLDADRAFFSDAPYRLRDEHADRAVAARGNRRDLAHFVGARAGSGDAVQFGDDGSAGRLDCSLERHRIVAGRDALDALDHDRLGERGGSSGAVAGDFTRADRDLAQQPRAHFLERIGQVHCAGNDDA